jgi:hypothetical protein
VILLLATADWCSAEKPLSGFLREHVAQRLHYPVPLIGGSTPRVFVSKRVGGGTSFSRIEQGFVAIILFSEDLWVSVDNLEQPYRFSPDVRRQKLRELTQRLKNGRSQRLGPGTSAAADLFGVFPVQP